MAYKQFYSRLPPWTALRISNILMNVVMVLHETGAVQTGIGLYILFKDVIPPSKQKNDKVDMVLRTTDNHFDVFSAEDKPLSASHKVVQEAIAKNQERCVVTLQVIETGLPPSTSNNNYP